jgi:hypothetical protein
VPFDAAVASPGKWKTLTFVPAAVVPSFFVV